MQLNVQEGSPNPLVYSLNTLATMEKGGGIFFFYLSFPEVSSVSREDKQHKQNKLCIPPSSSHKSSPLVWYGPESVACEKYLLVEYRSNPESTFPECQWSFSVTSLHLFSIKTAPNSAIYFQKQEHLKKTRKVLHYTCILQFKHNTFYWEDVGGGGVAFPCPENCVFVNFKKYGLIPKTLVWFYFEQKNYRKKNQKRLQTLDMQTHGPR